MNKVQSSLDMTFESFSEIYFNDMKKRLKENTWHTKEHILHTKLIPFFGKQKMCDIQPKDVIAWQNKMLTEKEKTAPFASVGADAERSSKKDTTDIISEKYDFRNPYIDDYLNKMNPYFLPTISMSELYNCVYTKKAPIIDGLLYPGTYLFVGDPNACEMWVRSSSQNKAFSEMAPEEQENFLATSY